MYMQLFENLKEFSRVSSGGLKWGSGSYKGPKLNSSYKSEKARDTLIYNIFVLVGRTVAGTKIADKIYQSCLLFKLPRQSSPQDYFS